MDMDDVMQQRSMRQPTEQRWRMFAIFSNWVWKIKSSLNHSPHWIVGQCLAFAYLKRTYWCDLGCWREDVEQKSSNGICISRNLPKRRSLELLLWWHCKELRSLQSFTSVALHQAAHLQQCKTPRNMPRVFAYKIIDDSILSSCCIPEAWPEISIEVSFCRWRSCQKKLP